MGRNKIYNLLSLFLIIFISLIFLVPMCLYAETGKVWVDTSHWEGKSVWVDTSHWESIPTN